ncbi:MAG TPA: molybdopterin-dependent oxidoreductase, partial [Acidimicrobiales bacterium]|nr:molybdopterin-dependent oxidoreductase [Acidimicrobiales bacterium]
MDTSDETRILPPGQRRIDRFPRFGTHLSKPPPAVPADPVLAIGGEVVEPTSVPVPDLAGLPRQELVADFHCVSGWTAVGVRWEGVPFRAFHEDVLCPLVRPGVTITHVVFEGLDGYRSTALLEDVLGEDVLLSDRLDGGPLGP